MTISVPDESQCTAAKVAGLTYLFALVLSVFAEFYVPARLVVYDNAAETARNIVAHEQLYRLGIASNLMVFAADVILTVALYVILKPVHRNLALVAMFWRLIETTTMVAATLSEFDVLRVLSGAGYLQAFDAEQLHVLARLSIGAHGAGYTIGLLFFGLGSTLFGCLWFRSNYIPRVLAGWGVLASALVLIVAFAYIVAPSIARAVIPGCYAPIFVFELAMGLWLPLKGLRRASVVPLHNGAGAADWTLTQI
jgi:hypothetical protein